MTTDARIGFILFGNEKSGVIVTGDNVRPYRGSNDILPNWNWFSDNEKVVIESGQRVRRLATVFPGWTAQEVLGLYGFHVNETTPLEGQARALSALAQRMASGLRPGVGEWFKDPLGRFTGKFGSISPVAEVFNPVFEGRFNRKTSNFGRQSGVWAFLLLPVVGFVNELATASFPNFARLGLFQAGHRPSKNWNDRVAVSNRLENREGWARIAIYEQDDQASELLTYTPQSEWYGFPELRWLLRHADVEILEWLDAPKMESPYQKSYLNVLGTPPHWLENVLMNGYIPAIRLASLAAWAYSRSWLTAFSLPYGEMLLREGVPIAKAGIFSYHVVVPPSDDMLEHVDMLCRRSGLACPNFGMRGNG